LKYKLAVSIETARWIYCREALSHSQLVVGHGINSNYILPI
jgi:hypothetical protein